ncbi:MAG TPA: agmatinase [Gemmatimonadaceae bacterium]|nr:agmatinase [Gemmatimonadaceae bacterium]
MPAPSFPTLLGLPYDARSSFLRGSAAAPPRIRAALHSSASNLFTETLVDLGAPGALRDAGDAAIPADASGAEAAEAIDAAVTAVLGAGGRPISLGGDHSVSYPALRAVRRAHPRLAVLHVDAHPDLYDVFEGDRYSHACPFARVMEAGLADQLVQVGIRAMNTHQRAQAERFGVEVIDMRAWAEGRRPALGHPVYVSIDLDGLDPAHAPGVSHREPGGLTVREVVGLLHHLAVPVIAADVVEYNPARDPDGVTAPVAAKLVKELAGAMHAGGMHAGGMHAGRSGA